LTQQIDSAALGLITRVLRLGGGDGAAAFLDDDNVSQVLNLNPIIRRSPSLVGEGWFYGIMKNRHAGADNEVSLIDVYNPIGARNGYPNPIPNTLDVWLLSVQGRRVSGAGALTAAALDLLPVADQQGWGVNDGGDPVETASRMVLARWDSLETTMTNLQFFITEQGEPSVPIGIRVPRGADLEFSSFSGGAANFDLQLMLGVFPLALGQDVVT